MVTILYRFFRSYFDVLYILCTRVVLFYRSMVGYVYVLGHVFFSCVYPSRCFSIYFLPFPIANRRGKSDHLYRSTSFCFVHKPLIFHLPFFLPVFRRQRRLCVLSGRGIGRFNQLTPAFCNHFHLSPSLYILNLTHIHLVRPSMFCFEIPLSLDFVLFRLI